MLSNNVEDFSVIINNLESLRAFTKVKLTTVKQLTPVNWSAVIVLENFLVQLDSMINTYNNNLK